MTYFFDFINSFGFNINLGSSPLVLFLSSILVLSIVSLLCILNIIIYFIILKVFESQSNIDWITARVPSYVMYLINIYRKTRIYYIIVEVLFLLFCNGSIIYLCSIFLIGLK